MIDAGCAFFVFVPKSTLLIGGESRQNMGLVRAPLRLFTGPMMSGKSEALISAIEHLRKLRKTVVVVTHSLDTRSGGSVASRDGRKVMADLVVDSLDSVPAEAGVTYAIDEAQFLGDSLVRFHRRAPSQPLLVSGLDLDFARKPFGSVLALAQEAVATGADVEVHKLRARCGCVVNGSPGPCGAPAPFTQRLKVGSAADDQLVLIGGSESYQPACEAHHIPQPVYTHDWGTLVGTSGEEL